MFSCVLDGIDVMYLDQSESMIQHSTAEVTGIDNYKH